MSDIVFSYYDYQTGLKSGKYSAPRSLCPYYEVDPVKFRQQGTTRKRRNDLNRAMTEVKKRTGQQYFSKTYPLQARTLDYSATAFPAYRFILPEVMTEDWLAIVDWGKFQRDHVLHQPLCGYIVLKLFRDTSRFRLPNGKKLLDECVDQILKWEGTAFIKDFLLDCGLGENDELFKTRNRKTELRWRIFFREAAYVAAIFHDLGYPWQFAERLQKNLDGLNAPTVRKNRSAEQIIELFGQRLMFRALNGYQNPNVACPSTWNDKIAEITDIALSTTHGLPGALGFLHLNDCVRRYPSPSESALKLLCIEWAATAIMMHDMCKIYWGKGTPGSDKPENPFLRLSFDTDPLSALITFVDMLQDFERPMSIFKPQRSKKSSSVSLTYGVSCNKTNLELQGRTLDIKYEMKNRDSQAIKRKSIAKEHTEYFDYQHGYLNMNSLGIEKVRMFAKSK